MNPSHDNRRAFLRTGTTLSAVGLALLAGKPALAQGMKADVSWDKSAEKYVELYRLLLSKRAA